MSHPDAGGDPAEPVRTKPLEIDLPVLSVAFARRLQGAGIPVPAERLARFAEAMTLVAPQSRRRLYYTARAAFVADATELPAFNRVFADVFGVLAAAEMDADSDADAEADRVSAEPSRSELPPQIRAGEHRHGLGGAAERASSGRRSTSQTLEEMPVPMLASDAERLARKRFDRLEPEELVALRALMTRLAVSTPTRLARRTRSHPHGRRVDMRRTLRTSMRTGGEPILLSRRRRRPVPRRLVLLCDISGSMEPYARVYLQFLACAAASQAGAGRHEAFAFATRLTRLTRSLHSRNPDRAIQRAATAVPDWSSGTRIGDALKTFNDRHGRRGMARGAVIVILSDGWERGDPALVGREMARLARLAHRIIWVNPRAAASGFAPRAGGMAAALPHLDALLAGESLAALADVIDAIGAADTQALGTVAGDRPAPVGELEPEPWASATPVPGSSVAMPSGQHPSRGHTTPGWSHG